MKYHETYIAILKEHRLRYHVKTGDISSLEYKFKNRHLKIKISLFQDFVTKVHYLGNYAFVLQLSCSQYILMISTTVKYVL